MIRLVLISVLIVFSFYSSSAQYLMKNKEPNFYSFSKPVEKKLSVESQDLIPAEFRNHPEFARNPYNAPCRNCTEIISNRKINERYFVENGTGGRIFYVQKSYGAMHLKDKSGKWISIDPRLSQTSTSGIFSAENQHFPVEIDVINHNISLKTPGHELKFNTALELLHKDMSGNLTSFGEARWNKYTAGNDGVKIFDIWPGIDMEIRTYQGRIKTNFIIKEKLALANGWLVVKDRFAYSNDLIPAFTDPQDVDGLYKSNLSFSDSQGQEYYTIDRAFAQDASTHDGLIYLGYQLDARNNFSVYVPVDWLNDKDRKYPVTIDPLVSASNTLPLASIQGSQYGAACFSNGCPYSLAVPVPANCSVTDVLFSFEYTALGGCVKNEGAMDFTLGTCRSPSLPTFFWFCDTAVSGLCTGNKISIFSDISGCIPIPQCASYNLTFGMNFYRCDTTGGIACSNSCIAATAPWIMTIQGRTVEIASITGTQTICVGNSATINASANFGVPPYTYSWSPGGMTGTTITASPSTNTTYIVTVTDACAQTVTATSTVNVNSQITPTFAAIGPLCQNSAAPTLPATSTNGITGTWSPATISTATLGTTSYTFTPNGGQCATTATLNIVVATLITPTFVGVGPLCQNSTAPILPATSTNGITGTWSPATVNTATAGTTVYTYTPTAGLCATTTTLSITVNPQVTPGFAAIGPLCQNSVAPTLPATSTNGIAGTWNPATISTVTVGTTTYTFTPNGGQCATTATLNIVVTTQLTPTFAAVGPLCQNSAAPTLPATSTNGITGTWNPAIVTTATAGTTVYTFTPTAGLCAATTTLSISVNPLIIPTFVAVGPLCQNSAAPLLPLTSTNGISGTWNPAIINTATAGTTVYTFTPTVGLCATTTTLSVIVNPRITPTFAAIGPLCQNSTAPTLPATSTNGITGTWNPATVNTATAGTTVYTFTPTAGLCAATTTLSITVSPIFISNQAASICQGQSYTLPWGAVVNTSGVYRDTLRYTTGCDSLIRIVNLQVTAATTSDINASICTDETYTLPWGTVVNSAGIYKDTVRTAGGCDSLIRTINLTVNAKPSITLNKSNDINCIIGVSQLNVSGGSQYLWSPAGTLSNPSIGNPLASPEETTIYHVKATSANGCFTEDSIKVIVSTDGVDEGFLLPNAFTPNGDGKNDCFGARTWGQVSELRLSIYNLWGEMVFFTTDPSKCWDGTFRGVAQSSAVFVYQISAKTICGYLSRKGSVVLIR